MEGGRAGISKNVTNFVTDAGSQLTWEGGRAGISKNVTNFVTDAGSQLTFLMFRFPLSQCISFHRRCQAIAIPDSLTTAFVQFGDKMEFFGQSFE